MESAGNGLTKGVVAFRTGVALLVLVALGTYAMSVSQLPAEQQTAAALLAQSTVGTTPPPVLAQPTMNPVQCSADGTSAYITWGTVPSAEVYAPRVDDPTNNTVSCLDGWYCNASLDYFSDIIGGPSIRRTVVPDRTYEWWVHAKRADTWSGASGYTKQTFTCKAPVNATVTLTTPMNNYFIGLGNQIPIGWSITGAPARSQVEYVLTQLTSDGTGTIGGGSGISNELPLGSSTGRTSWQTGGAGYLDRPGTYQIQLALRACNSAGCAIAPPGVVYARSQPVTITAYNSQTCPTGTTGTYPNCVTKPVCATQPAPLCAPGSHLEGSGNDSYGCPLPSRCVADTQTQTCPVQSTCQAGQTQSTTVDSRGCTMIKCTTPTQTTGSGHVSIKRVGADLTTATAPYGTKATVDSRLSTQMNPGIFTYLSAGAHTVYVLDMPGYIESAGTCIYLRGGTECSVAAFTEQISCSGSSCTMPISVSANQITKVVVKYEKDSVVTCQGIGCTQPTDKCSNLEGIQTTIPAGYTDGGSGVCSSLSCPQVMPPYCPTGTLVSAGISASGCSLGYRCETTQTQVCPAGTIGTYPNCVASRACSTQGAYQAPICAPGSHLEGSGNDSYGCPLPPRCVADVQTCPAGTTGTYPNCTTAVTTKPSCTITTNKASYVFGETITVQWSSQNATYATWVPVGADKGNLPVTINSLLISGSQTFTANVLGNPYLVLLVGGQGGYSACSKVIPVTSS